MSEWQPIETAPRDGSEILVWDSHEMYLLAHWYENPESKPPGIEDGWYSYNENGDEWPIEFSGHLLKHWMHLPEPPK